MLSPVFLVLSCYMSGVLSGMLGPCKKDDSLCLQKTINEVLPTVLGGIPSRGVDSSDPLFEKYIEGDLSGLKYIFRNSTITGFKNCDVKNSKLEVDALKLYLEMHCNNVNMVGDYEINGRLVSIPVEGKGTYKIKASEMAMSMNSALKLIKGKDGTSYINIKSFEVKPKTLGPFIFDFANLFNGQKDLSDAVHKFAHDNYLEVAEFVQDPIFNACFKSISKNINKFLKTEPLQEIFVE